MIFAQDTPLSSIYNQFSGKPGYHTTEVLPGSMNFTWEKDIDLSQVREMMNSIDKIRIVKIDPESSRGNQEKLWKKVMSVASEDHYQEIINVTADRVQAKMYILKGEGNITKEMAFAVKDDNGMILATMTGKMDFSKMFSRENMQAFRDLGMHLMEMKGACHQEEH